MFILQKLRSNSFRIFPTFVKYARAAVKRLRTALVFSVWGLSNVRHLYIRSCNSVRAYFLLYTSVFTFYITLPIGRAAALCIICRKHFENIFNKPAWASKLGPANSSTRFIILMLSLRLNGSNCIFFRICNVLLLFESFFSAVMTLSVTSMKHAVGLRPRRSEIISTTILAAWRRSGTLIPSTRLVSVLPIL